MRIQREGIEETRLTRSSKLSKLDNGYSRFITLFFLLLCMFEVLYNEKRCLTMELAVPQRNELHAIGLCVLNP